MSYEQHENLCNDGCLSFLWVLENKWSDLVLPVHLNTFQTAGREFPVKITTHAVILGPF